MVIHICFIMMILEYVWAQFNELDINLIYKMENYHIDPYIEEPQKLLEIKKAKSDMIPLK